MPQLSNGERDNIKVSIVYPIQYNTIQYYFMRKLSGRGLVRIKQQL